MFRFLPPTALLVAVLSAATSNAQPPERATRLPSISPAHCVATLDRREQADPLRCPAALRNAIIEARDVCRDAGGIWDGQRSRCIPGLKPIIQRDLQRS